MPCLQKYADGRLKTHCLNGHVIEQFPAKGVIACAAACRDEPRCRSFNLHSSGCRGDSICQLNSITRDEAGEENVAVDETCNYFNF